MRRSLRARQWPLSCPAAFKAQPGIRTGVVAGLSDAPLAGARVTAAGPVGAAHRSSRRGSGASDRGRARPAAASMPG